MMPNSYFPKISDSKAVFDKLNIKIAGINVSLISLDPEMKLTIGGSMERFIVGDCDADVIIQTYWQMLDKLQLGEKIFDSGGTWQLYKDGEHYLFRLAVPLTQGLPYKIARFNSDFSFGEILCDPRYFRESNYYHPFEYPIDELLFINFLSKGRGVEVHACGLCDTSGEGYLFIGQSEAGKSTTARLWMVDPRVKLLTDERVVLRKSGEQIIMHGTPWHGDAEASSPDKAVLNKVFFLRHWHKNEIVRLSQTEAAARFFACSFPPFYSREGLDFVLSFFVETAQRVPAYELRFVPDQSAVEFVRQSRLD
jgi:hypothetical protein